MKLTFNFGNAYRKFTEDLQNGPRIRFNEVFFSSAGLTGVVLGVLYLIGINPLHASGNGWVLIGLGVFWSLLACLRPLTRFGIRRLIPEDQLYDRLGVNYQVLNVVMKQKDVRPRLVIGGVRFYAHTDFGDVSTLLRASTAPPAGAEILLRPAQDRSQPSSSHLLHPASEDPVPKMSAENLVVATGQSQQIQIGGSKME